MTITLTIENALDAAAEAAFDALLTLKGDRGDCGAAWVVITARKGRKALVQALAARNIKTDRHHTGGVAVYICRGLGGQSRLVYEKGCRAFVEVLAKDGIDAFTYSYAD